MSTTKIAIGTACVIAILATGTALLEHNRAQSAEARLSAVTREQSSLQADLTRTEQQRAAAEKRAADADKDSATLLAAVNAARAQAAQAAKGGTTSTLPRTLSPDDPLAHSLQPIFPSGIVAILGDRAITVEDVRREILPILPKFREQAGDPNEFTQRLYKLQNDVIGDLITRQLWIKEFHNPDEMEAPKHIAAETIDATIAERVRDQFSNDPVKFGAYLELQGMTPAQYRQEVEEDIIYGFMRKQQQKLNPPKATKAK
jgi:hypothetical protein